MPAVYRWLAGAPVRGLVDLPIRGEGVIREETLEMYFSTYNWRPLVQGYTGYPPLLTDCCAAWPREFPSEGSLQVLQRAGVDTAVVHHGRGVATDLRHQVGALDPERASAAALRAAELDLYDQLCPALAAGRITRWRRASTAPAPLFDSTADEVYRIVPRDAAARPRRSRPAGALVDPAWRYRSKAGDPAPAADGDLDDRLGGRRRADAATSSSRSRSRARCACPAWCCPCAATAAFPTRFRVEGRVEGAAGCRSRASTPRTRCSSSTACWRTRAQPRSGFDLRGREVTGLALRVEEGGTSFEGWRLPEVEVRVR